MAPTSDRGRVLPTAAGPRWEQVDAVVGSDCCPPRPTHIQRAALRAAVVGRGQDPTEHPDTESPAGRGQIPASDPVDLLAVATDCTATEADARALLARWARHPEPR